jgi:hypothetical protein
MYWLNVSHSSAMGLCGISFMSPLLPAHRLDGEPEDIIFSSPDFGLVVSVELGALDFHAQRFPWDLWMLHAIPPFFWARR